MPPIVSASPFRRPRSRSRGPTARSPSPPPLPPKKSYIDLNSSTRSSIPDPDASAKPIRAFLSDVVVVGPENNETTALLSQLGDIVERPTAIPRPRKQAASTLPQPEREVESSNQEELGKLLRGRIEELVRTERSYVSRIKALKLSYADPLRHFAKSPSTSIIPVYEAKTLFGNIDAVLPAAMTFLADLEKMWDSGQADMVVGDVCLNHLKTLKTLDCYGTYIANQDEAQKTFNEMKRKHSRFVTFIDSTKYQTTGIGNIGLFELLMEPVQRVPRYILLWEEMVKYMSVLSPQRARLVEAKDIASRIARCEPDERTVRATVMYSLERNVDGFPASLFSNNRDYLDSIDAEDMTTDGIIYNPRASRPVSIKSGKSSTVTSLGSMASNNSFASPQKEMATPIPLHCTLVLFDDKLMITKRQVQAISGCRVTGLDDIKGLIKSGGGVAVKEKDGARRAQLKFRGVVDILEVRIADIGHGDFQLFFEQPITDQGDRWNLPLRTFQVCHPPAPVGLDLQAARTDKLRFVHNVWAAQALARSKLLPSQVKPTPYVLVSDETFDMGGTQVKAYWNVWTTVGWSAEQRKAKVLIEVASSDYGDLPLPEPDDSTRLIIRLEPLAGDLCRVSYIPAKGEPVVRELIGSEDVNKTVVERISKAMIYMLPSNNPNPLMQTPTLSKRASRMLFGSNTASSRGGHSSGDGFGSTSTMGTHGSRSITSQSSGMDSGALSGMDTISSAGHSLTQASPTAPRSPMSPCNLPSPPWSPAKSDGGHGLASPYSDDKLASRLDEARNNSRSLAAMASPRLPPPSPSAPSRVMAMREQLEARERQAKAVAEDDDRVKTRPSPLKPGMSPSDVTKRVPVPTLATSTTETLSRDSSLASLPQSPTNIAPLQSHQLGAAGSLSSAPESGAAPVRTTEDAPNGVYQPTIPFSIGDARKQARVVRKNVAALSQQVRESRRDHRFERQASLARSPHHRNIHLAELMSSTDDVAGFSATIPLTKGASEEHLKALVSGTQAIEDQLAQALADTERVRMLARNANAQADLIVQLEAQVARAKEREDLLCTQLSAKEIEVDEIYDAFNVELDGMYNDIALGTEDAVQEALRLDLQTAKGKRNELALENQRLRDELAKERLRREQMAGVLRLQGGPALSVAHDKT
ncbi:hypothetical protein CspeluHIS016_0703260 [Cutaneotrichosporon spelunceum]|uniref:DH domain-containing protein n=1 Tax=Cutaneotrichosporon spelunceum TaxID=1672016 RepID=A0AAD3TZA5_9TREE|nr:hypothetical protein CspeluHIS016_0703260 [Cutaneotrichosporon spelunceum]